MGTGDSIPSREVELEFAELHAPLFLGGKNHQLKLTAGAKTGIRLVYDRGEKELLVYWTSPNGKAHLAIVPASTVLSMWPKTLDEPIPIKPKPPKVERPTARATAQVSSPTGHVFEGPGKGKSRA